MSTPTFKPEPYWLLHHGQLLEWTTERVENRIDYIKSDKPKNERRTRLKWLRKVAHPERLPKEIVSLWAKGYALCTKGYALATGKYRAEIEALHREECPGCPFDYEKQTLVFPKP